MGFVKYTKIKKSSAMKGFVKVRSHSGAKVLSFSREDVRAYLPALTVELYYDPMTRQIGLLPVDRVTSSTLKITSSYGLSLSGFLKQFNLNLPINSMAPLQVVDGMIVLNIEDFLAGVQREPEIAAA